MLTAFDWPFVVQWKNDKLKNISLKVVVVVFPFAISFKEHLTLFYFYFSYGFGSLLIIQRRVEWFCLGVVAQRKCGKKKLSFFFEQERKKRFEMRKNWLHESLKIYFRLKRWLSKYNWKHISMLRRWLYGADGPKGRYRAWIECANATSTYSIHFVCMKQWANNSISSLTSDVSNFYCLALFCESDFPTATLFFFEHRKCSPYWD